jgi:hypothetical protein
MTPEEYRDRAEHFRRAKETAKDNFTRLHLATMKQSYRTLADSEEVLRTCRTPEKETNILIEGAIGIRIRWTLTRTKRLVLYITALPSGSHRRLRVR